MKHKKIFATIVAIACTLVLATGCSVTPHEDVMKSDSATIEQSDKADSKDVQKDESDKASDTKSDSNASTDKSDKDAAKESGTSADKSDSNASSDESDSSSSKPSGSGSSSHSGSSASKPSGNTSSKPSSGNSGSTSTPAPTQPGDTSTPTPEPSQPAHQHSYTSSVTTQPTCSTPGVRTYTCVSGDDSYTESIPATGHNWVDNVETVEHSDPIWKVVCNGCGAQFNSAEDAISHVMAVFGDSCSNYSSKIVGYNTYSETVSHGQICKICGATQ